MDDIFVIKKGLDVDDKIVLEGIRQVRDGEKVEYEFRPPEQVMANSKTRRNSNRFPVRKPTQPIPGTKTNPTRLSQNHVRKYPPSTGIGDRDLGASSCSWGGWRSKPCRSPSSPPSRRRAWWSRSLIPAPVPNVLVDSVLILLEQAINGVQDMRVHGLRRHQCR